MRLLKTVFLFIISFAIFGVSSCGLIVSDEALIEGHKADLQVKKWELKEVYCDSEKIEYTGSIAYEFSENKLTTTLIQVVNGTIQTSVDTETYSINLTTNGGKFEIRTDNLSLNVNALGADQLIVGNNNNSNGSTSCYFVYE